jgi:hypothetical protein
MGWACSEFWAIYQGRLTVAYSRPLVTAVPSERVPEERLLPAGSTSSLLEQLALVATSSSSDWFFWQLAPLATGALGSRCSRQWRLVNKGPRSEAPPDSLATRSSPRVRTVIVGSQFSGLSSVVTRLLGPCTLGSRTLARMGTLQGWTGQGLKRRADAALRENSFVGAQPCGSAALWERSAAGPVSYWSLGERHA